MSTPSPIPPYAVTGGSYWPTVGTIPIANDSDYYNLTDDTAGATRAFLLQAKSNPGVDPLDLDTLPKIRSRGVTYIHIPSLAPGAQVYRVELVRPYDDTTATVIFEANPTGMAAGTPTDIFIFDTTAPALKVENIGGAPVTINGAALAIGQDIMVVEKFVDYDASGSQIAISKAT